MNEMRVEGWFYLPTTATTNEEAYNDFIHRCREIGMNADNLQSIIVRDEEGNDITTMEKYF